MLQAFQITPASIVVLALVLAWAVWAIRRLAKRGMCDCHGSADEVGGCSCGGCQGCLRASRCSAAEKMAADLDRAACGK